MSKLSKLTLAFSLFALVYTVMLQLGANFASRSPLCNNAVFQALQPWDSACFYSAIFKKENALADLFYEKHHLDRFHKRGGLSPNIRWYRANFTRQFQSVFEFTNEQIDQTHWAFMAAQPHKLDEMVKYLEYLGKHHRSRDTQAALDLYCTKYVSDSPVVRDALASLAFLLEKRSLGLDLRHCYSGTKLDYPNTLIETDS